MEMKRSRVLDKLRAGEVVSCIKLNLFDSRTVEIAALSGVDCIWTDMEHVPNDFSAIEKQILAAKAYNTDIMVRVSRGSYTDHVKPLEMDASGIMVPHVMSIADAKNVVRMTRFHPTGRRPVDGGNADGAFCNIDFVEYLKQSNERRFVCIQIEDPEPLDELDEIAALEGIDMIFFGPADFSQGIGAPGQWDHPDLLKAREKVAKAAVKHGKFAATVGLPENLKELSDMGYRFISMGADVIGLGQYFTGIMSNFKKVSNSTIGI
ncbi:MAG: aldolase/citrate lyase family protein [Clostridiales bacterium]|nr:aldolase/citrate lyase family protein [Clostridiales bacterium]